MSEARWADNHLYDGIEAHPIDFSTARMILFDVAQQAIATGHGKQYRSMIEAIYDQIDSTQEQAEQLRDMFGTQNKIHFGELLRIPQAALETSSNEFSVAVANQSISHSQLYTLNQQQIACNALLGTLRHQYVQHLSSGK